MKVSHTLYLCYFGVREPLVQTQVLTYLREIKKLPDMRVSMLTFEPNFSDTWSAKEIKKQKEEFAAEGISWYVLPYHKSPSVPATLYDVWAGARLALKLIKEENVNILHARSYVPGAMGALAKKLSGNKIKLILDIRGFFPEEYTDAGTWKENGAIYKSVKRAEKGLLKVSDGFVVLTEKAREILFPESKETGFDKFGRPVEVIPCCVNLQKFESANHNSRAEIRKNLNIENRFVIAYAGSLGTWYMADEMADLLKTARDRDSSTFALILTQSPPEIMIDRLKERGFTENDFLVGKFSHSKIPKYLSAADAAISLIRACYSKLSSSPTKIAEYLASGLPIITSRGVGDIAEQIEENGVGTVIEDFNSETYRKALEEIQQIRQNPEIGIKCRLAAEKEFDLEKVGGEKYRRLYKNLLQRQ